MTESEELKNNIETQQAKEKVTALGLYLDVLTENIKKYEKRRKWSNKIYLSVWLLWVATSFFGALYSLFTSFFVIALIYDQICFAKLIGARKEFLGAIEVLRILGYIPPKDEDGDRSSKKSVWEKGVELVKSWKAKKKELQDKVFSPA